jgi:hypothetical protein
LAVNYCTLPLDINYIWLINDQITGILTGVKDKNSFLTLSVYDDTKELFFDSSLLSVNRKGIKLYRLPKWPKEGFNCFRIFFSSLVFNKEPDQPHDTHSISTSIPDTLHILKQRSCRRLEVPEDTRAAFIYGNRNRTSFQVLNVSRSGSDSEKLTVMFRLGNIVIGLTEKNGLPVVRQEQVVRRFRRTEKRQLCYGILFKDGGEVNEEKIWAFISQTENRQRQNRAFPSGARTNGKQKKATPLPGGWSGRTDPGSRALEEGGESRDSPKTHLFY